MKNCGQEVANKEKMTKSDSFFGLNSAKVEENIPNVDAVQIFPLLT